MINNIFYCTKYKGHTGEEFLSCFYLSVEMVKMNFTKEKIYKVKVRLWTSLNKAAPHEKTITELKKEIETLDKLFKEKLEQINQLARQQNMLEVLARIREGKNESGNATGSSPP